MLARIKEGGCDNWQVINITKEQRFLFVLFLKIIYFRGQEPEGPREREEESISS